MDELLEYGIYLALLVAIAIPLSAYINKVMAGERTLFSRVLVPVENVVYRCIRVDRTEEMGWKKYLVSTLAFSLICLVGLTAILMLQNLLPGNPEGLPGLTWDLAFNTAASFVTNTNWAGVQRRVGFELLLPGTWADGSELCDACRRSCRHVRAFPRHRERGEHLAWQLLRRCHAGHAVRVDPPVSGGDHDRRVAGFSAELERVSGSAAAGAGGRGRGRQHR